MKFENEITVELIVSLQQTQQILFNNGFELQKIRRKENDLWQISEIQQYQKQ